MSEVKRCVQCGLLKDTEQFRKYTYSKEKGTEGSYRVCKACEAINQAFRRAKNSLNWKEDGSFTYTTATEGQYDTYCRIRDLYKVLEARGLRVPSDVAPIRDTTTDSVEKLMQFYSTDAFTKITVEATTDTPAELSKWLADEMSTWEALGLTPEYLQETVYESLKAKYRPQTGVNKETFMPIYDDTYKEILNQILRRFDDYEEAYSNTPPG